MALLSQTEISEMILEIKRALSKTQYGCTTLEKLSGGTTSFVFRGVLAKPITDEVNRAIDSVIIKHATDFASCNRDFPLHASRSSHEALMLGYLEVDSSACSISSVSQFSVGIPHLYYAQSEPWVEIIQYLPDTLPLNQALDLYSSDRMKSLGYAIGSWLHEFHSRLNANGAKLLRQKLKKNKASEHLKWKLTYQQGTEVLDRFPDVLEDGGRGVWERIEGLVAGELEKMTELEDYARTDEEEDTLQDSEWGVVHGDFWTGNVLTCIMVPTQLYIIDFEFTQINHRSVDLGQFIGDLLEMQQFETSVDAANVIAGFLKAYGSLSDAMVHRTAIHTGVHMLNWWSRGPKNDEEEKKNGKKLVDRAWNIILTAWDGLQNRHTSVTLESLIT